MSCDDGGKLFGGGAEVGPSRGKSIGVLGETCTVAEPGTLTAARNPVTNRTEARELDGTENGSTLPVGDGAAGDGSG